MLNRNAFTKLLTESNIDCFMILALDFLDRIDNETVIIHYPELPSFFSFTRLGLIPSVSSLVKSHSDALLILLFLSWRT